MNEIIRIKQLPVLEERFRALGEQIDKKVEQAVNLVVTDENYKDIKKIRAELNKESKAVSDEFKAVKAEVLEPWEAVEQAYKENVAVKYKMADQSLGSKVRSVENELKKVKEDEIRNYFDELKTAENVDFITFEDAAIKVGLSDSKKSLKEKAKAFIERVVGDLELIDTEEDGAEILVEYKKTLNVSASITEVRRRHEAIRQQEEELKAAEKEKQEEKEHEQEVLKHVDAPLKAPVKKADPVKKEKKSVTFKVFFEKPEDLKKLAVFLKENYEFEQIKGE